MNSIVLKMAAMSFLMAVAPGIALAGRCGGLVKEYNAINNEYARTFNSQGKDRPCSSQFWEKVEKLNSLTRDKLKVARRIDSSGCRKEITGGNSVRQLEGLLASSPGTEQKMRDACAKIQALIEKNNRKNKSQAGKGKTPEGCLVLSASRPAGVGCGNRKEWFWTDATIKKSANCPKFVTIEYLDPDTGKLSTAELPIRLQSCGQGVTQARIKQ